MILSERSIQTLSGVHPDLVRVVLRSADGPIHFVVTEGVRTRERQIVLVSEGKSRTMNSRHLAVGTPPYSHAVDLAVLLPDGTISWEHSAYRYLSLQVKAAAAELGIPIEWGGEAFGPSFYDGPHFQLPWHQYPVDLSPAPGATSVT